MTTPNVPPLVPGLPLLGSVMELMREPCRFWVDAARAHGEAYRVRYPTAAGGELFVLAGLEANRLAAREGHTLFTTKEYYHRLVEETGTSDYLCALDGPRHAHMKRSTKAALSREAAAPFVAEIVERTARIAGEVPAGTTVRALEFTRRLTVDAFSITASNVVLSDQEYAALARYAFTFVGSGVAGRPAFLLKMPGYRRAKHAVHAMLEARLAGRPRREPGHRPDLLDAVTEMRTPEGTPLSPEAAVATAHLPFANGYIYAGRLCASILYALARDAALLGRVRAEIDAGLAAEGPTASGLRRMSLLRRCIQESHRVYPIAPAVPRYATRDFTFAGYTIPKGSFVFIPVVVPHHDERWFRDPERFDPDRFAPPRSEGARPFAFAPYGLGTHGCPAIGLVETVVMAALVGLLRAWDFEVDPPGYALRFEAAPVPGPEEAFTLRVRPRPPNPPSSPAPAPWLGLDAPSLEELDGAVRVQVVAPGERVLREGDPADAFYVVRAGEVEAYHEAADGHARRSLRVMGPGAYFGEIGLLHGGVRTASVRATSAGAALIVLDRELFLTLVADRDLIASEIAEVARRRAIASRAQAADLARPGVMARFTGPELLFAEGDPPGPCFLVVRGEVELVNRGADDAPLVVGRARPGDLVGLGDGPRLTDARAVGAVVVMPVEGAPAEADDALDQAEALLASWGEPAPAP
jgi:cytochrome P450/CRP-like cAMP-binding protein